MSTGGLAQPDVSPCTSVSVSYLDKVGGMEVHVEEHEGDAVALGVADAVGADLVVGVARAAVGRRGQGAVVHLEDGVAAWKEIVS